MSKYRVEVDIAFETEEDAIAFLNGVEDIKSKTFKGDGTEAISIVRRSRYHKCFHDDKPPKPCGDYTHVDFDAVKTIHVKESIL